MALVVVIMMILMEIMYNVLLKPLLWGRCRLIVDLRKWIETSGREVNLKIWILKNGNERDALEIRFNETFQEWANCKMDTRLLCWSRNSFGSMSTRSCYFWIRNAWEKERSNVNSGWIALRTSSRLMPVGSSSPNHTSTFWKLVVEWWREVVLLIWHESFYMCSLDLTLLHSHALFRMAKLGILLGILKNRNISYWAEFETSCTRWWSITFS